jgi:hypothetical protein
LPGHLIQQVCIGAIKNQMEKMSSSSMKNKL